MDHLVRDQDVQDDDKQKQVKNQPDSFRLGQMLEQMVESAVTKAFKAQAEVLAILEMRIDDMDKRLKEMAENQGRMVAIEDSEEEDDEGDESLKELIKILEVPWTKYDQVTRVLDDENLYEKAKELADRKVRNGKGVYGTNFNRVFFHKDFVGRCWLPRPKHDDPREGYLYGERHAILPMKMTKLFAECAAAYRKKQKKHALKDGENKMYSMADTMSRWRKSFGNQRTLVRTECLANLMKLKQDKRNPLRLYHNLVYQARKT